MLEIHTVITRKDNTQDQEKKMTEQMHYPPKGLIHTDILKLF